MECLLRPTLNDKETSAPWHGLAQVEVVRAVTEVLVHATTKEVDSTNKSVERAESWSVIGKEKRHAITRI